MDYYLLLGSLTLLLQVGTFLLLVGGFLFKKRRRFRAHGLAMFTAVVLHLVAVGVIMVPSYVIGLVPLVVEKPLDVLSVLSSVHAVFGGVAAVLGVLIVGSWRLRRSLQFCAPKRRWMLVTLWVWLAALFLGFLLYLVLFWSLLFG